MSLTADKLSERAQFNLDFLCKAFSKKLLANSYIFAGENCDEQKYLVAKELNKLLNCERLDAGSFSELKPCNQCNNCKWIEADTHPKTPLLIESIDTKSIKIAAIKEMQTTLSQSSNYFRIIIINPADYEYLNKHSANALLKSIEEPHPLTLYLLFASSKTSILNTLKSRSHCLQFSQLSEKAASTDQELTEQQSLYQLYLDYKNETFKTAKNPTPPKTGFVDKDLKLRQFLENIKKDSRELILNFLDELQQSLSLNSLNHINFIEDIERAKQSIRYSVNPKLVLAHLDIFREIAA